MSCGASHKKAFKEGFLHGYQACFAEALRISWDSCPANLAIVEQVTLARNLDQHPETNSTFDLSHSKKDFRKFPRPFVGDDFAAGSYNDPDAMGRWWLGPRLRVPAEKLLEAIDQADLLATWLAEQVAATLRPPYTPRK